MVAVLSIETSCDETALAFIRQEHDELEVLFDKIYSQESVHNTYGGVVPEIASREHLQTLPLLLNDFHQSGYNSDDVDLVTVTCGPGLKGCLLVGMSFALGLSRAWRKPLRAAHHVEGHILSGFLAKKKGLRFPYLALLVSGGHTEIVLVRDVAKYEVLSRTRDDAAGEAFDKSAKLLGLPYPGGRHLSALAEKVEKTDLSLGTVMPGSMEMSFSGLKTAIARMVKGLSTEMYPQVAFVVERTIVDTLLSRVQMAVKQTAVSQIVLCGGVAANRYLRSELDKMPEIDSFIPEHVHCTDNAAMIAVATIMREKSNKALQRNDFTARSRWPLEELVTS